MMKHTFILVLLCGYLQLGFAQKKYTEYADVLVEAWYSGANPEYKDFYGGNVINILRNNKGEYHAQHKYGLIHPSKVLGHNLSFVSLPTGSYVIVQFTDNLVVDAPDQDDLFIQEVGCAKDRAEVYVSADGKNFVLLGIVEDCKTNSLDLASIGFKEVVRFVKVVGLDNNGFPGYDLVSIKGLPGASIDTYTGIENLDQYFKEPLGNPAQKIILENIRFEYNKASLLPQSQAALDLLTGKLQAYPQVKIKITGHTDDTGEDTANLKLSQARAKSVLDYLIQKGISANRLSSEGKGEIEPLKPNDNEANRAINRRVEIERIH